jgi:hypothetical protein
MLSKQMPRAENRLYTLRGNRESFFNKLSNQQNSDSKNDITKNQTNA